MADVFVIRWWLVFACACKAADAFVQTGVEKAGWLWVAVALVLCLRERPGYAAVTVAAFGTALAGVENASHHVVVLGWVALPLALFADQASRRTALWSLTVVIYAFAAVNKLAFGFLSGDIIREHSGIPLPPVVWPLAVAAVTLEGWLAWAVWKRSRYALPVAIALHAGIVIWSGATSVVNIGIAVMFNGLLVLLVWESLHGPHEVNGKEAVERGGDVESQPSTGVLRLPPFQVVAFGQHHRERHARR